MSLLGQATNVSVPLKWEPINLKQPQIIEGRLRTQQTTWDETMGTTIMAEINFKFDIDFNNDIFHVIDEAAFMEALGFVLPVDVRAVALQKDRVYNDRQNVTVMLQEYNALIEKLSMPEVRKFKYL